MDTETKSIPIDYTPLYVLCVFSVIMLTIPLGVFYLALKYFMMPMFIASMSAVVCIQFIIGGYIFYGWREEKEKYKLENEPESQKSSKNKKDD